MRVLAVAFALGTGLLLASAPAWSNTINFGSFTNNSSCTLAGNGADRSCTTSSSVSNGANDNQASVNVRGQASADHGLTTNPTAVADLTVSYSVPYTVTRTVNIVPQAGPAPELLVIPTQVISFDLLFSGEVSKDNSQVGGGLGQALLDTLSVTVSTGLFGSSLMGGDISQTGGGGLSRTPFNRNSIVNGVTGRNFSGPGVGEISFAFEIPTDYQDWEDNVPPAAINYLVPSSHTQSITDTLTISFRLRAESRPSGSISTTGGEALACAGLTSPLSAFDLDNAASCGSGLTVFADTIVTGSTSEAVPEPGSLVLLGLGVAGLAFFGARRRRS